MSATPSHHLTALWFADIVGYTSLSEADSLAAYRAVERFQDLVQGIVNLHGGRVVKFLGDGVLAQFSSIEEAVRAADELQFEFSRIAKAEMLHARHLRVGVHLGDVAETPEGDLYGDGVNIASRIQSVAKPGEVWVSDDVRRQLRQHPEIHFARRGSHHLKGLGAPLNLYAAGLLQDVARARGRKVVRQAVTTSASGRRALAAVGIGILVALTAVGISSWWQTRGGTASASEASIAVLPFDNLSGDPQNEYFSDGVTDDILTSLSKVEDLRVISRTSTLQYKGSTKPIHVIADELGVATVLEGSVRRAGNHVRITAQLIDAETDEHIWAETYDRELTDVFAIQDEIAARIADQLSVALTERETARIEAGRTASPEAYDLVLRARMRTAASGVPMAETAANARAAIELLNRAIDLDRTYAGAYATLGEAYSILVVADNRVWADSALAASRRAIELEPDYAEGHEALGSTWDALGRSTDALESYQRAIELDPNSVDARSRAAERLYAQGRFDEALETILPAVRRDPNDLDLYIRVAALYAGLGLYDLAEAWAEAVESRQPDNGLVHATRAYWEMERGDLDGAEAEVRQALTFDPGLETVLAAAVALDLARGRYDEARRHIESLSRGRSFEYAYIVTPAYLEWKTGNREEAERVLAEAERRSLAVIAEAPEEVESYMDMARIESIRGDADQAMSWMQKAYERGARFGPYYRFDPRLENLHDDPRFRRLTERMDEDVEAMRERAPQEEP